MQHPRRSHQQPAVNYTMECRKSALFSAEKGRCSGPARAHLHLLQEEQGVQEGVHLPQAEGWGWKDPVPGVEEVQLPPVWSDWWSDSHQEVLPLDSRRLQPHSPKCPGMLWKPQHISLPQADLAASAVDTLGLPCGLKEESCIWKAQVKLAWLHAKPL